MVVAGDQILIYDANGNSTGTGHTGFQNRRRNVGKVQLEWTTAAASTVTIKIQGSADGGRDAPWTTLKSLTEADIGDTGGSVIEAIDLMPGIRVVVSNNGLTASNVKAWMLP